MSLFTQKGARGAAVAALTAEVLSSCQFNPPSRFARENVGGSAASDSSLQGENGVYYRSLPSAATFCDQGALPSKGGETRFSVDYTKILNLDSLAAYSLMGNPPLTTSASLQWAMGLSSDEDKDAVVNALATLGRNPKVVQDMCDARLHHYLIPLHEAGWLTAPELQERRRVPLSVDYDLISWAGGGGRARDGILELKALKDWTIGEERKYLDEGNPAVKADIDAWKALPHLSSRIGIANRLQEAHMSGSGVNEAQQTAAAALRLALEAYEQSARN